MAITAVQIQKVLPFIYEKATKSVEDFAEEYKRKYRTPEIAAKKLINWQIAKCGTSGFVTGFGGFATMVVALPANITSVLYVQLRMIAAIAYLGGHDLKDDAVQTMIFMCLAGESIGITMKMKKVGIEVGNKVALKALKKLPGNVLTKINQKIVPRLLTKFGRKGIVNLGKTVPFVGALLGAGIDIASTKIIASLAVKYFIDNPYIPNDPNEKPDEPLEFIDADFADEE
jgi:hypothetical protein